MLRLGYSRVFTILMAVGIIWSAWGVAQDPPPLWHAVLILLFSLWVTDPISGVLHVILDNPRSLDVAALRGLAEGFQRHHDNPAKIYEMPLYEHLYVMHLPLTIVFAVVAVIGHGHVHFVALCMVLALHLMQMAHLWAHLPAERVPAAVRGLQRVGLLLTKAKHDDHHTEPFDKNFCIMTGLANRPLNAVVGVVGGRTHWWNAAFLALAATPLAFAMALGW